MTEAAIGVVAKLLAAYSEPHAIAVLTGAPVLQPAEVMQVVRNAESYGFGVADANRLKQNQEWLATALQALTGGHNKGIPAGLYGSIGAAYRAQGNLEEARRFYGYSFENATTPGEKAAAVCSTGIVDFTRGDLRSARAKFDQARRICEKNGVGGRTLSSILVNLGNVSMAEKEWGEARSFFQEAAGVAAAGDSPDMFATARLGEAQVEHFDGQTAKAVAVLDALKWLEVSDHPRKGDYLRVRSLISNAEPAEDADHAEEVKTLTIEELERRLEGLRSSSIDKAKDAERFKILTLLAMKYFQRTGGQRTDNLRASIHYWEDAKRHHDQLQGFTAQSGHDIWRAGLHGQLGLAFNELHTLVGGEDYAERAQKNFEQAIEALPPGRQNAPYRSEPLNNLGNAIAYQAEVRSHLGSVKSGKRDDEGFRRSLALQTALIEQLADDPSLLCPVLLNLVDSYWKMGKSDQEAARQTYYPAIQDCLKRAEDALSNLDEPPVDMELGLLARKAQISTAIGRPEGELREIGAALSAMLSRKAAGATNVKMIAFAFRTGAELAQRTGDLGSAYRWLLRGTRYLRRAAAKLPRSIDESLGPLAGLHGELVRMFVEANEVERSLFFANERRAGMQRWLPYQKGWTAAHGSTIVFFDVISMERVSAWVITEEGISFRDVAIKPVEMLRLGGQLAGPRSIAEIAHVLGKSLFGPILNLLPEGGPLSLLIDPGMEVLPLHLAVVPFASGKAPLSDRFEVTYSRRLAFEPGLEIRERSEGNVFVASYSPPRARLPFAALEARAVAQFHDPHASVRTGEDANPEAVLAGLEASSIVHLCCHGSYDSREPLESKLYFAGRPLTVREIQLRLERSPCDLIVLSACEAGIGGSPGDPKGFPPILLKAGCRAVIAADWRVDDLSTTILMARFHWELARLGLRQAALALAAAQRFMQAATGQTLAEFVWSWGVDFTEELLPGEADHVTSRIEALAAAGAERVMNHPVHWGGFAVREFATPLARAATTGRSSKANSNRRLGNSAV